MRNLSSPAGLASALVLLAGNASAHELTSNLFLDGTLSAAAQCQRLSSETAGNDTCKGAVPFQPKLTYQPTGNSRLFLKLGFAAGDGLNQVTPFNIPPWGADLESDVENINGSGRNHLLEAWYQHVITPGSRNRLGFTFGLIDATQYLDQNAYANDEYVKFMNPALSNAPNALLPSYDPGIAAEWFIGNWSFTGVVMDVHQLNAPENYAFYGAQVGYKLETGLGTGNYRVLVNAGRNRVDQTGTIQQKNDILLVSADQRLGRIVGAFARVGWRIDDQPINYRAIYSGGVDINGSAWNRVLDNVGIGLVYLEGANNTVTSTRIAEIYYRLVANPFLAFTGDIQYNRDDYVSAPTAEGMVFSARATVNF